MPGLLLTVAGGAVEGALLGGGQWLAMRPQRPSAGRWIPATAIGAVLAWTLGMLPSTLGIEFASPVMLAGVVAGAGVLLASIPTAQWVALGRPRTARWIPVNMGAWAVGLLWTFAPSPIIDERSPVALVIALYVIAGLLMALTVAAITMPTARRLFGGEPAVGTKDSSAATTVAER